MHYTFDYFIDQMKSDPHMRITREKWNDSERYIFWDKTSFLEHRGNAKNAGHIWCWKNLDVCIEDLNAIDWKRVDLVT